MKCFILNHFKLFSSNSICLKSENCFNQQINNKNVKQVPTFIKMNLELKINAYLKILVFQ